MGQSVVAIVVYGVKFNWQLLEKLKSKAREESDMDEDELDDEDWIYDYGRDWLESKFDMNIYWGCDYPPADFDVLGFPIAGTDVWNLGIFDCEFSKKVDEMNKFFKTLDPSLSPELYQVSSYV